MKRLVLIITTMLLTAASPALAQNNPVPVTGGRFLMQDGAQDFTNARIETANFTAVSWVSDTDNSIWNICSVSSNPPFCLAGTTFRVPSFHTIDVGSCSACNPPQFPRGTFTINGATYQNVYFSGQFRFSEAAFLAPMTFLSKRKGFVRFRKPFTMTGDLQVCRVANTPNCPAGDILFNGQITGEGTLKVTTKITVNNQISPRPFLLRESIEYQFEP